MIPMHVLNASGPFNRATISSPLGTMEEGTKAKKTVFVGGIAEDVDEAIIYETFSTFDGKHRGFAFVTYSSSADAQDAIDNMDLNELRGKVIKVNLARPMKTPLQLGGNRAVWESEEWLKQNLKPLAQARGQQDDENNQPEPDDAMEE
ncbi:hypothetical protein H0H92_010953 [Tricholoma furcatifolium]|nr:hypothetical protein H0H92_010953 [Tricholoma furcatifolium]